MHIIHNWQNELLIRWATFPVGLQYGIAITFGLCVGSFLNVVAHRVPIMMERAWRAELAEATNTRSDVGVVPRYNLFYPPSTCPHCAHGLRARENIPLVSYLLQQGRCRHCTHTIGISYPIVELASGLLAACALAVFGPTLVAIAAFGLCATLLALSTIDIRTGYLPDSITLPLLWAGLVLNLGNTFTSLESAVIGAISGYMSLWLIYWLFRWLRGVEGIGFGDLKLLAALGAWMGWTSLPQIIVLAAAASLIITPIAIWFHRARVEEPIAFGPFLAIGCVITLFFGSPFYSALGYTLR